MRFSKAFIPTRKEDPAEAEVVSHNLLVRGGYIRMVSRGIYDFLPLAWRSIRKIEEIVRQEMDRAGAQEVLLPAVQPAELWQESGRWEEYGPELLRFEDRKGADFCLGPTHEEVITDLVRGEITSYKQLPMNLYQIQTKFRDEPRPRFGLMRGREFIMKDAYSFDLDEESAQQSYDAMFEAYNRICERLGFEFRAVEADSGNIGGSRSHEFQVLADTGEDEIASCPDCGYAANTEKAEIQVDTGGRDPAAQLDAIKPVETPGARTIEEISAHLKVRAAECVKTLIYMVDEEPVAVLVRGDHGVNEIKLKSLLEQRSDSGIKELRMAHDGEVREVTDAPTGFAGPVGLEIPVFADHAIKRMANFVVGANADERHFLNTNHGVDFDVTTWADLRTARPGDACGRCGGRFEVHRGIEVGHVFYLGSKYSESMNAMVQDEEGVQRPFVMGCYGIGITRMLAAIVEQNHDEHGIIWPVAVAPYQVIVMPLQFKNDEVMEAANSIYTALRDEGVEVLLDDRDARAGEKFNDADLVGIPLQIRLGSRGLKENNVEFKRRDAGDVEMVDRDAIVEYVLNQLA